MSKILTKAQALHAIKAVDSETKMISTCFATDSAYVTVTEMYGHSVEVRAWTSERDHKEEIYPNITAFATAYDLEVK